MSTLLTRPLLLVGSIQLLACQLLACASSTQAWQSPASLDQRDVPEEVRPGFGDAALRTWWPLTPPERAALAGLERARQGELRALLALAILAGGDARDAGSYAQFQQRVDRFLVDVKPVIDAATDDWHRGYELHRAMHRVFFNGERTELGSYDFNQSRVAGIFKTGKYNCLSSAMLYVVLARGFGLPVRAALVPTHVFVQMGQPGGKLIEIETTSDTGFDWVHDARFYRENGAIWAGRRGLRPVTLDEYQRRRILEPHQLMAIGMRNAHVGQSEADSHRLYEVAALVSPEDVELQRVRMQVYHNEANALFNKGAWRTLAKLFDTVGPAINEIGSGSQDVETLQLTSWARWFHAHALLIVGRTDQAMALTAEGLSRLDASWPDAGKLQNNYANIVNDRLGDLISKNDFPEAVKVFADHRAGCAGNKICVGNAGVAYLNWSISQENAGDWFAARRVLQSCVTDIPDETRCQDALKDLESRHRF